MTRRKAREQAFIIIFEGALNNSEPTELIAAAREALGWEADEYVDSTVGTVFDRMEEIDSVISERLRGGWSISRLSKVTLSLLRLAICEMKYSEDVPEAAAINEAVELCKKYATDEDAAYLNGVLGAVARSVDTSETIAEQ